MSTIDIDVWHQYRIFSDGGIAFQFLNLAIHKGFKNLGLTFAFMGICLSIEYTG